jgi:hypothetical protein
MAKSAAPRLIHAPLAIGELIDKITILEIKAERIADGRKRANVDAELKLLRRLRMDADLNGPDMQFYACELKSLNARLWDVEDALRECETRGDFGARFVELARSVYQINDRRSSVKRRINLASGSYIVEEKSY